MQEGLAQLSAPARIWIGPIPSGMKNFALGVFANGSVTCWVQSVFPGRVNRVGPYWVLFALFSPLFTRGGIQILFTIGDGIP